MEQFTALSRHWILILWYFAPSDINCEWAVDDQLAIVRALKFFTLFTYFTAEAINCRLESQMEIFSLWRIKKRNRPLNIKVSSDRRYPASFALKPNHGPRRSALIYCDCRMSAECFFLFFRQPDPHSFASANIVYRHSSATHLAFAMEFLKMMKQMESFLVCLRWQEMVEGMYKTESFWDRG